MLPGGCKHLVGDLFSGRPRKGYLVQKAVGSCQLQDLIKAAAHYVSPAQAGRHPRRSTSILRATSPFNEELALILMMPSPPLWIFTPAPLGYTIIHSSTFKIHQTPKLNSKQAFAPCLLRTRSAHRTLVHLDVVHHRQTIDRRHDAPQ